MKMVYISLEILRRIRNALDKRFRENRNTVLCSKIFSENRSLYETMWQTLVQPDRPHVRT